MVTEFRVVGPPGTGKTTWLSRQAYQAAEKHGAKNIMLTSLTKAAAFEIAGRETLIPRENIGTLHAFAWRAIDSPPIAEGKIKDWNVSNKALAMSVGSANLDDAETPVYATQADEYMAVCNIYRQRMIAVEFWPQRLQQFYKRWCGWKDEGGLKDFTDLIEIALKDSFYAPGIPNVIMGDEAQDWSKLEAALMRKWGDKVETFVLVGDPDQSIFSWRGADPAIFQTPPVPDEQRRILKQSYRLPRAVHATAMRWIQQIKDREQIEFLSRDEEGEVKKLSATYKSVQECIDYAQEELHEGRSVMILTSCAYMLEPIKAGLRAAGIAFHNPYRPSRGDWNPMASSGVTAGDRLLAFIARAPELMGGHGRIWTLEEFQKWTEHVKVEGTFARGGKAMIETLGQDEWGEVNVTDEEYLKLFVDEATYWSGCIASEDADPSWLAQRVIPSKIHSYDYPLAVFKAAGSEGLSEPPRIVIGTVHCVKGGEADTVIVFPDLSLAGMNQYITPGEGCNEIVRLFYVAMTRARQRLVLASPSSRLSVEWN